MEKDPFISDEPLYDYSIEYDITHLPQPLQELIKELEEIDKTGDWLTYDYKFQILDIDAKGYVRRNRINEFDYKQILKKYGWIYDWDI